MQTIAAIITAPVEAAVSIIKISGPDAFALVENLVNKKLEHRKIEVTWLKHAGENLDQVVILPFRAPQSYTGEDVVEIHLHGGIWITEKVLELILDKGALLAKPGEFTERAVINGKVDLAQAEAIMDMIEARTRLAGENAVKLYQGYLGQEIKIIRDLLLHLLGAITASIDFPDEVGDYCKEDFLSKLDTSIKKIDELLAGEEDGHILRNGYKVALLGNPNAGKSTLLNKLLKKERAIVTEIAGTTRDLIEESYSIKGLPIVLADTAGIRASDDKVEKLGIEKSKEAIVEADLVLVLQDLSEEKNIDASKSFGDLLKDKNCMFIGTKLDLVEAGSFNENIFDICVSVEESINISELEELVFNKITKNASALSTVKINHRQADLLRKAREALIHSRDSSHLAEDFWTIDLRAAIQSLGEITGESLTEELLDNIFSRFCIGK